MSLSININDNNESTPVKTGTNGSGSPYSSSEVRKPTYETAIKPDPTKVNLNTPSKDGKPKTKKPRRKKLFVILTLLLFICGGGAFAATRFLNFTQEIGIKIKPTDILSPIKKDPELKKDSTGKRTNALLVGIDTRETDGGLRNTDTIIVASYDHATGEATMISVPRDTYVAIPGSKEYVKINSIYNYAEVDEKDSGLVALKGVVEEYTGLEIQYYGMVNVKGLSEVIDIIGGIDLVVENSFTDYMYPNEKGSSEYMTVSFKAGPQTMDGETAVIFSRSRKSLDNGEGTDFARARRQQKVLKAIQDKVLSTETLLDPKKMIDIMVQIEENIKVSEFTNEDMQAGLKILRENSDLSAHSFVLEPSIGAGKLLHTGAIPEAYSISPVAGFGKYDDIHSYVQAILTTPQLYEENPRIYTYDIGIGNQQAFSETKKLSEQYPYLLFIYQGTLFTDKTGTYIYDNSSDSAFPFTPDYLSKKLTGSTNGKPEFVSTRLNGEDLTILFGAPPIAEETGSTE